MDPTIQAQVIEKLTAASNRRIARMKRDNLPQARIDAEQNKHADRIDRIKGKVRG